MSLIFTRSPASENGVSLIRSLNRLVHGRDALETGLDLFEFRRTLPGAEQIAHGFLHFGRIEIANHGQCAVGCSVELLVERARVFQLRGLQFFDLFVNRERPAHVALGERIQGPVEFVECHHLRFGSAEFVGCNLFLADLFEFRLGERRFLEDFSSQPKHCRQILAVRLDGHVRAR